MFHELRTLISFVQFYESLQGFSFQISFKKFRLIYDAPEVEESWSSGWPRYFPPLPAPSARWPACIRTLLAGPPAFRSQSWSRISDFGGFQLPEKVHNSKLGSFKHSSSKSSYKKCTIYNSRIAFYSFHLIFSIEFSLFLVQPCLEIMHLCMAYIKPCRKL